MTRLYVHYETKIVGTLDDAGDGILSFSYDTAWLAAAHTFPISLAMPLQSAPYTGKIAASFFENLIPEGEARKSVEKIADLPEGNNLAFLERFGEDCAGALSISSSKSAEHRRQVAGGEIKVSFETIERAVREGAPVQIALRNGENELPPFSLAGAQAKFPCIVRGGQIYLPSRGEATTHIVKLPIRAGEKLLDSVPNEYLSMRLAAACGLNVPSVALIGHEISLFAIERFDRATEHDKTKRLHTQDFCQAMGRTSDEKYERHGGPSFTQCYELVKQTSQATSADLLALLDWITFNMVIGNNDSHSKNLSLIQGQDGPRLAPFYDLICTAIYLQYNAAFAFKVGGVTSWQKLRKESLEAFANQLGMKLPFVRTRWLQMTDRITAAVSNLAEQDMIPEVAKTFRKIEEQVTARVREFHRYLGKDSSPSRRNSTR